MKRQKNEKGDGKIFKLKHCHFFKKAKRNDEKVMLVLKNNTNEKITK